MIFPRKQNYTAVDLGRRPGAGIYATPVELIREGYARFQRRELRGVLALFAPDIEIVQTTELPWGGRYCGHAGAREFFWRLIRHTDAMPEPIIHVPAGDDVVVMGRLTGRVRTSGRGFDLVIAHVWSVRAGKIRRLATFVDTPAMLVALGTG